MNDSVIAIVSAFFIIGITVGIIAVVAISALRAGRRGDPGDPGDPPEYGPRRPGGEPPKAGWDDAGPDDHPNWPGDVDNDFTAGLAAHGTADVTPRPWRGPGRGVARTSADRGFVTCRF